jgi:hypothetical protein
VRSFPSGAAPIDERLSSSRRASSKRVARRRQDADPGADVADPGVGAAPRDARSPGSLDALRSIVFGTASPFAFSRRGRAPTAASHSTACAAPRVQPARRISQRRAAYAWIDALPAGEVRATSS